MKRIVMFAIALTAFALTAAACEKYDPFSYKDSNGREIDLHGLWGLIEVQYCTAAGLSESHAVEPETFMEFCEKGICRTYKVMPDGSRQQISTCHYDKARGGITFFTNEEFKNNQYLSEDDSQYERGATYYFKVIDNQTISSKEPISGGSYVVNIFARF